LFGYWLLFFLLREGSSLPCGFGLLRTVAFRGCALVDGAGAFSAKRKQRSSAARILLLLFNAIASPFAFAARGQV